MLSKPDFSRFFGDYQWAVRSPFSHPQCVGLVQDFNAAVDELRKLYPPLVCRELVAKGGGRLVMGLFLDGWVDEVGMMLLLGSDLALCTGWEQQSKLIADLQSPEAFESARFEVGVWAGLRRAGLVPTFEAAGKSAPGADLTFDDAGVRVALELKSVASPDYESVEPADYLARSVIRVLRPVRRSAIRQLAATPAKLRAAVVWAGRYSVPVEALRIVADRIESEPAAYPGLDAIGLVNCHAGGQGGWETVSSVCELAPTRTSLDGMAWPTAIRDWSLSR